MDIVVFGSGSLGSLIGGLLAEVHSVTLVGRDPHIETVQETGLQIVGSIESITHPEATTDGTGLEADLAVVTVKSFDTETAAEELTTGEFSMVLSLQNGLGNEKILAEILGAKSEIIAGTTTYGALLRSPGVVQCSGIGDVVLGPWKGGDSGGSMQIATAFTEVGIETHLDDNMPFKLWEKLAVNAAINPITALARCRNGALALQPAIQIARQVAIEAAVVARSNGVDLSDGRAVDALTEVIEKTAANTSSMAYDVANRRQTEIESINGYIVNQAPSPESVPINATLTALIQTWEQDHAIGVDFSA